MWRWRASLVLALGTLAPLGQAVAQTIELRWGLENQWSYYEPPEGRSRNEDLADHPQEPKAKRYRAFAFKEGSAEVREPWLACIDLAMNRYKDYERSSPKPGPGEEPREHYMGYLRRNEPTCMGQFQKTAPRLYFDFTSSTAANVVLDRIEIKTISFSEYKGGGFADLEAGYDILLSHTPGTKVYYPEPRLTFSDRGRIVLRFWSDNFYSPSQGWVAPMGEYTVDIVFIFTTAGKTVSVRTGPFKMDV